MSTVALQVQYHAPYPGLRPFRKEDAQRFFGRGQQIEEMLKRLETHRFLAVVGASGAGKSSLVYAGLLPALEEGFLMGAAGQWCLVTLRPGNCPLHNLAVELTAKLRPFMGPSRSPDFSWSEFTVEQSLRSSHLGLLRVIDEANVLPGNNVLIMVDQFEEIFRYRDSSRPSMAKPADPMTQPSDATISSSPVGTIELSAKDRHNEAVEFVNLILEAAQQSDRPVYVVLTMRSDFLGNCDLFSGLPEAINDSQFLTPRMTRDQLRAAIVGPLTLFNAAAEPALVDRVLNDVGTDPDQLPLMQHALMRTWKLACDPPESWKDRPILMRVEHYSSAQVGGVIRALNEHAEETYAGLSDSKPTPLLSQAQTKLDEVIAHLPPTSFRESIRDKFRRGSQAIADNLLEAPPTRHSQLATSFDTVWKPFRLKLRKSLQLDETPQSPKQRICERMFRCLSDVNASGQVVRRLATVQEIADIAGVTPAAVAEVAEVFLDPHRSFLVASTAGTPTAETTLDISHEALLRQWDRLRLWIKTEKESADTYRHWVQSTTLWKADRAGLWGLTDIVSMDRWRDRENPNAAWARRYTRTERSDATFEECKSFLAKSNMLLFFWIFGFLGLLAVSIWTAVHYSRLSRERELALAAQLRMFSEPTAVAGTIAAAVSRRDAKNVDTAYAQLISNEVPYARTIAISRALEDVGVKIKAWVPTEKVSWNPDLEETSEDVRQSVLKLAQAIRIAWETQGLHGGAKDRSRDIIVKPTYDRAIEVTRKIADGSAEPQLRDEFESLYWTELVFLETDDVETAMIRFRRTVRGDPRYQSYDLKTLAAELKAACDKALAVDEVLPKPE